MSSSGLDKRPQAYVLSAPWELFDRPRQAGESGRRRLSPVTPVQVPAGWPLYVAAPANAAVFVDGRRLGAHRETSAFNLGPHRLALHSVSIGTRDEDASLVLRLNDEIAGQIQIQGHLPRPNWSLGRDHVAPTDVRAERLDLYLLGLVDLIRLANDTAVAWHESGWARLAEAWTGDHISLSDPPMALIVRHAETLQRLLQDLIRHPRRILSRTRIMTPVDRVQQLDVASVRWLSRQPGRNIYQRAGPRQRILAVQRFEDLDTLENRVLRDFAIRSDGLATAYVRQYPNLENSLRRQKVDNYRRDCHRLARNLHHEGIGLPRSPIVPNFALLQDHRYRRLWRAYLEIIRRLDEQDECWRWQHRLWADFCRLAVQVALQLHPGFRTIAESPLRIATEQQRGCWSLVDAQSGVFLIHDQNGSPIAVLSVLWDVSSKHPKLEPWMASLGTTSVLHLQNLKSEQESYLLIWPLHFYGTDTPDLEEIAESGHRALKRCLSHLALSEDKDVKAEGLVLVSNHDPRDETGAPVVVRSESVVTTRFRVRFGSLKDDIENLGVWLRRIALRLVTDP